MKNSLNFSLLLILIGGIPKELMSILPVSISLMKMRKRENPREFSSSLHLHSKMRRRGIYSLGGGLLADEEKGEIKEIFPFSPFTHENEEKGESKGIFLFSPFT